MFFFPFSSDHQQAPWVVLSAFQLSDVLAPSNELGNVFFLVFNVLRYLKVVSEWVEGTNV